MPLPAGIRLGRYEILAPLGAGGMGEVYRARDTRLDRSVAIKVLPPAVASDPDFRQRFHTEARALSQLSHPHICTLHDFGEEGESTFLVMELLGGETIAERLSRATPDHPAFTLGNALPVAIQIADALAAAHQRGIVHRDLKPGNVMITESDGRHGNGLQAKLLDFGLAKAAAPAVTAQSLLPTTPPQAVTAHGTIVGTVQYMAPEQIDGGTVDARTDIFAFGCMLFEMLTGRKPFEGKSAASVMGAILEREPASVASLTPGVPAVIDATIRRCLAKNPDHRWQSAADLSTALRWAADGLFAPSPQPDASRVDRRPRVAPIAIAIIAIIAAGLIALSPWSRNAAAPAPAFRFEIQPPPGTQWTPSPVSSTAQLAFSPDGRLLALIASPKRGVSQIWIRALDSLNARPLAGTDGAAFPFWSPDSRHIGFFADGKLKRVDLTGGTPQSVADAPAGRGGTWGPDGNIVFTPAGNQGLSGVSAEGGPVFTVTRTDDAGGTTHYWPQFLPDGRRLLLYQRALNQQAANETQGIYVKDLESGALTRVLAHDARAVYVPGYLLVVREGTLFAHAFDERTLKTVGQPARIADSVGYFGGTFGDAAVSASPVGVLAYGPSVALATTLQWRDRKGAALANVTAPGAYRSPRLSPSERHLALHLVDPKRSPNPDVWLLDVARGALSVVTTDPRSDWFPVWSPDESAIFFGSARLGATSVFKKLRSGGDETSVMGAEPRGQYPTDITRDGGTLVLQQLTRTGYDLMTMTTGSNPIQAPYLATRFNEVQGRLSPNGRWIAYASDESGRFEVYVRPFPAGGTASSISIAGGMQPEWRKDGRELFYVTPNGELIAVPVTTAEGAFSAGTALSLFTVDIPEPSAPFPNDYAVSADGQRVLVNSIVDQPARPSLTVVVNWLAELQRQ
jgi:serine/threonine protein kinase/Tol biopolymer transport system component